MIGCIISCVDGRHYLVSVRDGNSECDILALYAMFIVLVAANCIAYMPLFVCDRVYYILCRWASLFSVSEGWEFRM